jgi:hypothetical protein
MDAALEDNPLFRYMCQALTACFGLAAMVGMRIAIEAEGAVAAGICLMTAGAIFSLALCTRTIWQAKDLLYKITRGFWIAGMFFGGYFVYVFCCYYMVEMHGITDSNAIDWQKVSAASWPRRLIALLLTALLPMAAIATSVLSPRKSAVARTGEADESAEKPPEEIEYEKPTGFAISQDKQMNSRGQIVPIPRKLPGSGK